MKNILSSSRFTYTTTLSLSLLLLISLPRPSIGAGAAAPAAEPTCNPRDQAALLQIKADFNNNVAFTSWDPNTDCCTFWQGVQCHLGRVISIGIDGGGVISGQISPAIGNLRYLQSLDINDLANITRPIPSTITKLNRLQLLSLRNNRISGQIPSFLGRIKTLRFLYLDFNLFTGPIPASLSQLPNINDLYLQSNRLSGPMPESFGHFVGEVPSIHLSNNFLSGPLPRSLGYVNFSKFDVSFNNLTGDASFLFGKNKTVNEVELNSNSFQFDLSGVEFSDSLMSLKPDHNKIYGSLPRGLAQLKLRELDVSHNKLCGKIPQGGSLQDFSANSYRHNKCLCGAPLAPCRN